MLVVSFGRLGDVVGRVRIYNLGFVVFSVFSVLLAVTWLHGRAGALWLIVMRVLQGVGGAMLMASSIGALTLRGKSRNGRKAARLSLRRGA